MDFDVVVVGAGPAGLQAAIAAAQAGAEVCLCDDGMLGGHLNERSVVDLPDRGGAVRGSTLSLQLQEQAGALDVAVWPRHVVRARPHARGLVAESDDGATITGRRAVVATGRGPGLSGNATYRGWEGRGVIHCVSCDGPLVQGLHVVVVAEGPVGLQEGLTARGYADQVTVVLQGWRPPQADIDRLAVLGVPVLQDELARLVGEQALDHVVLASGRVVAAGAVVAKDEGQPEPPLFLADLEAVGVARAAGHVSPTARTLPFEEVLADAAAAGVWAATGVPVGQRSRHV